MQIEDKRKAKAKLQATCNSYAERNGSIRFYKLLGRCSSMELLELFTDLVFLVGIGWVFFGILPTDT
jgi:hypothetical protein